MVSNEPEPSDRTKIDEPPPVGSGDPVGGLQRSGSLPGRLLSILALALVLWYPVHAFLVIPGIPLAARLIWPLAAVVALAFPWASLLVFVAAGPLLPVVPREFGWPPVSLLEMWLLALLVAAWVRRVVGRQSRREGHLPNASTFVLVIATTSLIVTLYPLSLFHERGILSLLESLHDFGTTDLIVANSQRHPYASVVTWLVFVEGIAVLWLVIRELSRHPVDRAKDLLGAAAIGTGSVALFGIYQWETGRGLLPFWVLQDPHITRINATFLDVNGLGAYLAMMLFVLAGVWQLRRGLLWRWSWGVVGALAVLACLFTASRAAWAAAMIGLGLSAIGLWRFRLVLPRSWLGRHLGRTIGIAGGMGVLLLVCLTAYATVRDIRYGDQRSYLDTLVYSFNLTRPLDEHLKGRLVFWEAGARMVEEAPMFGIGIGRFYKEVAVYASRPERLPRLQENAHNYFLQIAAELGLVGLTSFLALLGAGLWATWRGVTRDGPIELQRLSLAAGVGIVVLTLTSLFGHPLLAREGQVTFWCVVGATLALGTRGRAGEGVDRRVMDARRRQMLQWTVLLLIVVTVPVRVARSVSEIDLSRVAFGLYPVERDPGGQPFRWGSERVQLHVSGDRDVVEIPVRSLSPVTQTVRVFLDGRLVDEVVLPAERGWVTLRYPLPRESRRRFHRIELHTSPVWQSPRDVRELGVMVAGDVVKAL